MDSGGKKSYAMRRLTWSVGKITSYMDITHTYAKREYVTTKATTRLSLQQLPAYLDHNYCQFGSYATRAYVPYNLKTKCTVALSAHSTLR